MSGNTVAIRRDNGTETMTITGLVELSEKVGKHGSDIEKLKQETGKLDRLEKEVDAVVSETSLIRQEIKQLNINDEKIEVGIKKVEASIEKTIKGNIKFRYYLAGGIASTVILIFGCMVWTLLFGLDLTAKSQATMKASIEKTIKAQDEKHTDKYNNISSQFTEIRNLLIKEKRPK